jgi:hypothetical protein
MGLPDSIRQGARKNCPYYILSHWEQFKARVAALLKQLDQEPAEVDADGYPTKTPAWQKEGFEALVERGIINSPEVWKKRFDEPITAREVMGILGRM